MLSDESPQSSVSTRSGLTLSLPRVDEVELRLQQNLALRAIFDAQPEPVKLDDFIILGRLGQGSMGVVYAAYDTKLDRKVAIKRIATNSVDKQRRFQNEAKAMAKLTHPNVVQIYDTQEYLGKSCIIMEYIDGLTLNVWLAERSRTRREIIDAFLAAGRGLAAAHDAGIIHRDFKPANVMVATNGRVTVMDFSLAYQDPPSTSKDSERLAPNSMHSGTPAYMAPEQHIGAQLDARTDMFSFCVALWEALFGERPFAGSRDRTYRQSVLEDTPREPANSDVPQWLCKVVRRGLETDPTSRYEDMNALLKAMVDDPTVRICRLTGALTLILGIMGAVLGNAWHERHQRSKRVAAAISDRDQFVARAEAACEREGQSIAELWNAQRGDALLRSFEQTEKPYMMDIGRRVRAQIDHWSAEWSGALESACIQSNITGQLSPERLEEIRACLGNQRRALEALLESYDEKNLAVLEHAASAAARLQPPANCQSAGNSASHHAYADFHGSGEASAVILLLERATIQRFAGNYDYSLALAREAASRSEQLGWVYIQLRSRVSIAASLRSKGEYAECQQILEDAVWDALAADSPEIAIDAAANLIEMSAQTGVVEHDFDWVEFGKYLVTAYSLKETMWHAQLLNSIAHFELNRGNLDTAIQGMSRSHSIHERLLGAEHPLTARILANVGEVHREKGDYTTALRLMEKSVAIVSAAWGDSDFSNALTLHNIGNIYFQQGFYRAALTFYERSLEIRRTYLGLAHGDVAASHYMIGLVYHELADYSAALGEYEKALIIWIETLPPTSTRLAAVHTAIANSQYRLHILDDAELHHRESLKIWQSNLEHVGAANSITGLGTIEMERGDYQKALGYFEDTIALLSKFDRPPSSLAMGYVNLARAQLEVERYRAALESLEHALALSGDEHHIAAEVLQLRATTLFELGRLEQALSDVERALEFEPEFDLDKTLVGDMKFLLVHILWELGNAARALEEAEKAHEFLLAHELGDYARNVSEWIAKHTRAPHARQ